MTPTEHYRKAEERLETASQAHINNKDAARDYHLAVAQIHATLATAVVAAAALNADKEQR